MREREIRMVAQMYEMRDTARRLLGAQYKAKMTEFGDAIQSLVRAEGSTVIRAGGKLAAAAGGGMVTIIVVAAIVELLEPSNASPSDAHVAA